MKKILFLIILAFSLTGCSAEYNLTIDENSVDETILFSVPKNSVQNNMMNSLETKKTPISQSSEEKSFYSTTFNEDSYNYYLKYNYKHNYQTFRESYFLQQCYEDFSLSEEIDKTTFSTSEKFLCLNLDDGGKVDSVEVNIDTKLKVLENNADEISGNTYTWNINSQNYTNKPIYIEMETKNGGVVTFTKKLFIGVSFIVVVGVIIFVFVMQKNKKNNVI